MGTAAACGANFSSDGVQGAGGASSAQAGGNQTTSAASGGGTSSTSTGTGGKEICGNAMDDDGNGQADCADAACKKVETCVPAIPEGWKPAYLYLGDAPPECGTLGTQVFDGGTDPSAPDASCGLCACSQVKCSSKVHFYKEQDFCMGGGVVDAIATNVSCDQAGFSVVSIKVEPPAPSCNASGGKASKPPITYTKLGRVCSVGGPVGSGCGNGQVCLPVTTSPFHGGCIQQETNTTCPTGYPSRVLLQSAQTDTRDCTQCICNQPDNSACANAVLQFFGDKMCANGGSTVTPSGNCLPMLNQKPVAYEMNTGSFVQLCGLKSGAMPTGSVQYAYDTVCCTN